MQQIQTYFDYDVIIIGAGMGGLTAGNILLKKGYKVLIVESHNIPGGYCTNFRRKDYTFETSLHMLNGCNEGGMIYNVLKKFGAENCVEFIKLEVITHYKCPPKNIDIKISPDLEKYVSQLASLFPQEADNIRKFYKAYGNVAKFMLGWGMGGFFGKLKAWIRYFRAFLRFFKCLNATVSEIIDPYIKDPVCKNLMTALGAFFGLGPDDMSALLFLAGSLSYYFESPYYPKGGSGSFSKAIAEIFVKNGGNLMLSTEAIGVNFSGNLAIGVKVQSKNKETKTFSARVIISNSDLTALVTKLCPQGSLPIDYVEKIRKREPCYSAVIIYLGLNVDLRKRGINDYELWQSGTIEKETSASIDDIARNLHFEKLTGLAATIYSNVDPACCPKDKAVISSIYYATPELFLEAMKKDNGKRGENYKALKDKIGAEFVKQLSTLLNIPDLEKYIEVLEVATPITLMRYTGNREGSFIGWEMTPNQMLLNQIAQKTPAPNLFLAGGWTMPGGGVSAVMASGDMCSVLVDKYLKKVKRKKTINDRPVSATSLRNNS